MEITKKIKDAKILGMKTDKAAICQGNYMVLRKQK